MSNSGSSQSMQKDMKHPILIHQCLAEALGTFILVFVGLGSAHAALITGIQISLWQAAVIWGIGIAIAIYATSAVSGAHLNPAITLALASYRGFPWRRVVPYILAQLMGAILAAAVLYGIFHDLIAAFEASKGVVRGGIGSEISAMFYTSYFPNPAMAALAPTSMKITLSTAMLVETIGTALLAFVIFTVTDGENLTRRKKLVPLCIGLTVSLLISILAPISQAGMNPARDFGPRLVAFICGWGSIAIPGPAGGFFTVYILAPCIGALSGGALYKCLPYPAFSFDGIFVLNNKHYE